MTPASGPRVALVAALALGLAPACASPSGAVASRSSIAESAQPSGPCAGVGEPAHGDLAGYERIGARGWTVQVSRDFAAHPALRVAATELLDVKLYDVTRTVPEPVLAALRAVPIFLELEARDPCAVYHPSRGWLVAHGYRPEKARCVEIANACNFLRWSLDQPSMLVHELAHAYHHRVLGYDHAGIRAAYEAALASGAYDSVLRYDGGHARAYAMENEKEYFAEIAEAWFGVNDFHPFVRAELLHVDPRGHALLASLFDTAAPPATPR